MLTEIIQNPTDIRRIDPRFVGMFVGIVKEVYKPSDKKNINKYQYEYIVVIDHDLEAQLQVRCIMMDTFGGSSINFNDLVLDTGQRVLVEFPEGDNSLGVIIGGSRLFSQPSEEKGTFWKQRFNNIEQNITDEGNWSLKYVSDPENNEYNGHLSLKKNVILIGTNEKEESDEQSITLDGEAKKITIKSGEWELDVAKEAKITIKGDASISCQNAKVDVQQKAELKAMDIKVTATKKIAIKSTSEVSIDAAQIKLNKGAGMVVTTVTHPTDYITGLPIMGSPTVKSG